MDKKFFEARGKVVEKAIYIKKFGKLWKVHDLKEIAVAIDADEGIIKICQKLNPHYIATRYPLEVEYTKEIAGEAFGNSRKVVEWVKKKIGK